MQILSAEQEVLLHDERKFLHQLRQALDALEATPEDQQTLGESIEQLDDFFLLVIVGEFNAGKSALINALVGDEIVPEGVTPTTTRINIVRYGAETSRTLLDERLLLLTDPAELLREISIVDTPGTNAIIREHELITSRFLPRADLVLFVTSADRPFTESERAFLQTIRDWGKKIVLVLNKVDILHGEEDLEKIRVFIDENVLTLLGIRPQIFPVSARQALRAKQGQPQLWQPSRFEALETYLEDKLDESSRLKLKFLNPLGIANHLLDKYRQVVDNRLAVLAEDVQMIDDINQQLELYRQDMQRDFEFRMADVENILYEMEERGTTYFDATFHLGRVLDLLKKDYIQAEFQRQVIADVPRMVERKVSELVDWLVDADLRQWQSIAEHLAERRQQYKNRLVGDIGIGSFHYDRERLIHGIGRETQQVVDTYDRELESQKIAEGAQTAVAAAAAMEVGAVGLGALITAIATTVAVDVTGILLASLVAILGLFVIPARRRKAKADMHARVAAMRLQLTTALRELFTQEFDRSIQRIKDAIAPYTRFVRAERAQLESSQQLLQALQGELARLQDRIGTAE
jgi:small GTP-binding protein